VDISYNVAMVGAPYEGYALVQSQKLAPLDLMTNASFGITLSVDGNAAIVGAPGQVTVLYRVID